MYRKMNFKILAIGFFFVAFAVNLNAQDSPNGIPLEPDDPIVEQTYWNRTGNPLFVGSGNKLGSTNAFPIQIVTSNTPRIFVTASGMVGINTTAPLQKLHVMDGNILISRSRQGKGSSELGSTNGTLYFGDVVSASHPYGKWGIEYVSSAEEGYGLNFWKPAVPGQIHGNHFLFLSDNGNVGVGTKNPQAKLHIQDGTSQDANILLASTGTNKSVIQFRTNATNITVGSDNVMRFNATSMQFNPSSQMVVNGNFKVTGNIVLSGLSGATTKILTIGSNGRLSTADIPETADNLGNHTATQNLNLNGKKIVNGASSTDGIFVSTSGSVGIGTSNPLYKLSVNGTILAKEIRVNEDASYWPDFVFDKDYELMSISEVKQFVSKHKHLPSVPSAADIDGKDVSLGEMNRILLQKIEELTLYIIDLQRQIDEMKQHNEERE